MCLYKWKLNLKHNWKENRQPQEHKNHSAIFCSCSAFHRTTRVKLSTCWVCLGYIRVIPSGTTPDVETCRDTWWHQRPSSHGTGHFLLWYVRLSGTHFLRIRSGKKRESHEEKEMTTVLGGELPTNRKWVITPVISGLTLLIPLITGIEPTY